MLVLNTCICVAAFSAAFSQATSVKPIEIYKKELGSQYGLYNGPVYKLLTNLKTGHAFFRTDSLMNGSVAYDGFLYQGVPLMLDEMNDELVTIDFGKKNLIQLVKQHVSYFSIGNDRFVKKKPGETEGYYQQLYAGRSELLKKEIKRSIIRFDQDRTIDAHTFYYVLMEGAMSRVRNKQSFLKLLGEHRKTVDRYLRRNNLRYKTAPNEYLTRGVKHYDELSN